MRALLLPRLRRIQDLCQGDVGEALDKLRGVSAECTSLLGRVLQVDPAQRLTLLQIMEVRKVQTGPQAPTNTRPASRMGRWGGARWLGGLQSKE